MTLKERLDKIGNFFVRLFAGLKKYEHFVEENMPFIIEFVKRIIGIARSPEVMTIESLLGDKLQNKTEAEKEKILSVVEKGVDKMQLTTDCLGKPTLLEKLQCFGEAFKKRSETDQNGTAAKLASTLLLHASHADETVPNLKESVADGMAATYFLEKKIDLLESAPATPVTA